MIAAGAIDFVFKLLVLNNFGGMREGLHGGSELVRLQQMVHVSLHILGIGTLAHLCAPQMGCPQLLSVCNQA